MRKKKINRVVSDRDQQRGSTITSRLDRHRLRVRANPCKQEMSDENCLESEAALHVNYFLHNGTHFSPPFTMQESGNCLERVIRAARRV